MRTAQLHSETKDKLLDAAVKLMLEKGFTATRVDEICEAAELTKGSFFHYFDTKEDIAKAALARFCEAGCRAMADAPFNRMADPLDKLHGFVDFFIEKSRSEKDPASCLVGNFSQELSKTHDDIRECCAEQFEGFNKMLREMLNAAKSEYAPKSAVDTRALADYFWSLIQGSLLVSKAKQDRSLLGKNLKMFKNHLKFIFEGK